MQRSLAASRALTVVAAGFLAFDGACLVVAGWVLHRAIVAVAGLCLIASSGLVFIYWRKHRRDADAIARERAALGDQARDFRDLIQRN